MTRAPIRIQRSRAKGWKMPEGAVYVGRGPGCKFGNPFRIGLAGPMWREAKDHAGAVGFFEDMLADPELRFAVGYPSDADIREELRGKDLVCFCPLDCPCHAETLLRIANEATW
jgi:Domain of unknown function (DUF4326)